MTEPITAPSPWSATTPGLQRAWDATSIRALMFCARYYQYNIVEGWRPKAGTGSVVDLEFGGYFASAVEVFKKARLAGKSKDDATLDALAWVLEATWDGGRPWGGHYADQWRCTGSLPFKNDKGNRAKCPFAKAHIWQDGTGPGVCTRCGSPTEAVNHWLPADPHKDRYSLVRLVLGYCDEQHDTAGLQPYAFPDGTPAVELSFRMPLPWRTPGGETYILCGHIDSIMAYGSEHFPADNKTTKSYLGKMYFSGWQPHAQFDTYDLAGTMLFPQLKLDGFLVEAASVANPEYPTFGFHIIRHSEEQREEYLRDLEWWLGRAEEFATTGYYPMNRANCSRCQYRGICSMDPASRERWLAAGFDKRHWNPLEER